MLRASQIHSPGEGHYLFGPGSDVLYNIDKRSGELRHSILSEEAVNVRIANGLSEFDLVMPKALPQGPHDVDQKNLYAIVFAEIGKYYNFPSWGTAGCRDSFFIDVQVAMEDHEGILFRLQSVSTPIHDIGYLAHGELYDAGMLIFTDLMIKRARWRSYFAQRPTGSRQTVNSKNHPRINWHRSINTLILFNQKRFLKYPSFFDLDT